MSKSSIKGAVVPLKEQHQDVQDYVGKRLGENAVDKAIAAEIAHYYNVLVNVDDIAEERRKKNPERKSTPFVSEDKPWKRQNINVLEVVQKPLVKVFAASSPDISERKKKSHVPEFVSHFVDARDIEEGGFYAYNHGILRCLEKKTAKPLGRYQHVSLFEKTCPEYEAKTMRIPHSKFGEKGVRQLQKPEFFGKLISALTRGYACDHPVPKDGDTRSRYYTAIQQSGDLVEMAGDLRLAWTLASATSVSSATFAQKTCRLIAMEYAITAGIDFKDALSEIEAASGKPENFNVKSHSKRGVPSL